MPRAVSHRLGPLLQMMGMAPNLPMSEDSEMDEGDVQDQIRQQQLEQGYLMGGASGGGSPEEQMAMAEQGYAGAGGSTSPLNVRPLSERVAGIGQPPTKAQRIAGMVSDIMAGAVAGGARPLRRATALHGGNESPMFGALQGGLVGFQAGEQNRINRENRQRVLDMHDFGVQEKLYKADLDRAKAEALDARSRGESEARGGYFAARGESYRARAKQVLEDLKRGIYRMQGGKVMHRKDDGTFEDLTPTETGKIVRETQQIMAEVERLYPFLSEKEKWQLFRKKAFGVPTDAETDAKKEVASATAANQKLDRTKIVEQRLNELLRDVEGHDNQVVAARALGRLDDTYPVAAILDALDARKVKQKQGLPSVPKTAPIPSPIATAKETRELAVTAEANRLIALHGTPQKAFDQPGLNVEVYEALLKAGAKRPDKLDLNMFTGKGGGGTGSAQKFRNEYDPATGTIKKVPVK